VKVLVTGASGFIGGHLVEALIKQDTQVRILSRPKSNLTHLQSLPIEVICGDLSDVESLRRAAEGVDIIYHCAALSSDWGSYSDFETANVQGVHNLLDATRNSDTLKRFVHLSTTDVYGYPIQACDERYPITDIGLPYNKTKGLGEKLVWDAHQQHGVPVTIIRPVSVYGPRGTAFVQIIGSLIDQGMMTVFNGGHTHAGLLYIDNAVEFILRASLSERSLGQVYNLRDDFDINWRNYVDALALKLHKRKPWLNIPTAAALLAGSVVERMHSVLHLKSAPILTRHAVLLMAREQGYFIDKAKRELDFKSRVGFDEGVDRSAYWFRHEMRH